jgi:hypothetical protein
MCVLIEVKWMIQFEGVQVRILRETFRKRPTGLEKAVEKLKPTIEAVDKDALVDFYESPTGEYPYEPMGADGNLRFSKNEDGTWKCLNGPVPKKVSTTHQPDDTFRHIRANVTYLRKRDEKSDEYYESGHWTLDKSPPVKAYLKLTDLFLKSWHPKLNPVYRAGIKGLAALRALGEQQTQGGFAREVIRKIQNDQ